MVILFWRGCETNERDYQKDDEQDERTGNLIAGKTHKQKI